MEWRVDDPAAEPMNRREIVMKVYDAGESLEVVGRLTDFRHGQTHLGERGVLHDMELRIRVDPSTSIITDAYAKMHRFPHTECPNIEPAFQALVGLSVIRGYTRAVQDRLGRAAGCSHLEFLARAMGPTYIQGLASKASKGLPAAEGGAAVIESGFMTNSCHIWVDGGPAPTKLKLGWRPGGVFPAPSVEEIRSQMEKRDR